MKSISKIFFKVMLGTVIATVVEYMNIVILQEKMKRRNGSMDKRKEMIIMLLHKKERQ